MFAKHQYTLQKKKKALWQSAFVIDWLCGCCLEDTGYGSVFWSDYQYKIY